MKIKKAFITNITVFSKLELSFSQGINIFIGTNGVGKTHLLKLLYAHTNLGTTKTELGSILSYFGSYVGHDQLQRKVGKDSDMIVYCTETFDDNKDIDLEQYAGNPNNLLMLKSSKYAFTSIREIPFTDIQTGIIPCDTIYIPAKDILSHSKGFLALYNERDIPFDKTYIDIISKAELGEAKQIALENEKILSVISDIIDGDVIFEDDSFYVYKKDGRKVVFSIEAEGYRKFGLLWKLIRNGLIKENTILFWDEPESNINPELMPQLVDILIELRRIGVQIFIATHSYNIAKYFEIGTTDADNILVHNMVMGEDGVEVKSYDHFPDISENAIIESDSKLLDKIYNFDTKED